MGIGAQCSSLPLEDFEGLHLEVSGNLAHVGVRLARLLVDLVKLELLLFADFKEVHLDRVVTAQERHNVKHLALAFAEGERNLLVHEEPAAGVHEEAAVGSGVVSLASRNVANLHLARGKQVDARDRLVANRHVTLDRVHCQSAEVVEVLEECLVRRAHGQLHLCQFWHHTEEAHLLRTQHHRPLQVGAL